MSLFVPNAWNQHQTTNSGRKETGVT